MAMETPSSETEATTREGGWAGELRQFWDALPYKAFVFPLLGAWALLFHFWGNSTLGYIDTPSLWGWLIRNYNSAYETDDHGPWVPLVVLGLLWWRRDRLRDVPKDIWWPALAGVALALLLHGLGFLVQQARISAAGLFLGLYSLTGLFWGRQWLRHSLVAFLFLGFCIPIGSLADSLTFPLRMVVTQISVGLSSGVLGIDVVRDGSRIFDLSRTFQYDVAPACSGIRSLMALLLLAAVYGVLSFERVYRRCLLLAVAVPLAVAGNVVRIISVIIIAEAFGQAAGEFLEQKLGFLTFIGVALGGLFAVAHGLRETRPPAPDPASHPEPTP